MRIYCALIALFLPPLLLELDGITFCDTIDSMSLSLKQKNWEENVACSASRLVSTLYFQPFKARPDGSRV